MRPAFLGVAFLPLALAARPGEVVVLPFVGLPPGEVEVASELPLLLPPGPSGEGPLLVVVEVPREASPGTYRVCLRPKGGKEVCQGVEVEAVGDLEVRLPREVHGGSLRLLLRNRGNVPERVHLAQAEGSEVGVSPTGLTLAPGEEREVELPLSGYGLLRLALSHGKGRALYRVRVLPQGGGPLPYTLQGRVEGTYGEGAPGLRLSLEGPLSREVGVAFLGGTDALRLALRTGPWRGRLSLLPGLEGEVGYREGPHALSLAYPWALEWTYAPREVYRLRLSPEALALGYGDGTLALGLTLPWNRPEGLSLRLERYGDPYLHARYEGGLYGGFAWGGWRGEVGYGPQGPSLRLGHTGALHGLTYALEGRYWGGPGLGLALGYPLSPFLLSLRGALLPQASLALGLGYREGPFQGALSLGPGRLSALLEWREAPYALRLEGRYDGALRLALAGSYAFRLPVPEPVTLALGGYETAPVEGWVEVLGRPVAGARVVGKEGWGTTDGEGRFRLHVAREGEVLRIDPPPGLLALPGEVRVRPGEGPYRVALTPAGAARLLCEGPGRGAYLLGPVGLFLACGNRAVVPPGTYRVEPVAPKGYRAEGVSLELPPLAEEKLTLTFAPIPEERLLEARPLRVDWPPGLAPGEVGEVLVRDVAEAELQGLPLLRREKGEEGVRLLFQVPWEAQGSLALLVRADGKEARRLVPLDPTRPLLRVEVSPPRAPVGGEVEVRLFARFPAEGAGVYLEGERLLPLSPSGEGPPWTFVGKLPVTEEVAARATPLGNLRALGLEVRAWQGEREVRRAFRLLIGL
ncbi:hypothetical protein [Thermus sediminis]|uniref:hypothetical protein n=1 Tax=Thermus sediminis TaxID=1761908 RepID=UPI000E3CE5AF|nr:hypothetical protein [Thermus sediminis]